MDTGWDRTSSSLEAYCRIFGGGAREDFIGTSFFPQVSDHVAKGIPARNQIG